MIPDDRDLIERIEEMVALEHRLLDREAEGRADEADRAGLEILRQTLDRLWDPLRQRRARQEAGLDPDEARMRDVETVEGYEQ